MVSKYMTSDGYNKQMVGEQGPRAISRNLDQLADDSPTQIQSKYIAGTPSQPQPQEPKVLSRKSRALASLYVSFCSRTQEGSKHLLSVGTATLSL